MFKSSMGMTPEGADSSGIHSGEIIRPPRSVADRVYEYLKNQIILSRLGPGARLIEQSVGEALGVSRTPVREAFRLLEQEGLVERLTQGGVKVTSISQETVKDIFGVRVVLEAYAMELACERRTAATIRELRLMASQARLIIDDANMPHDEKLARLFELNTAFHDTIYRSTGSPQLIKVLTNLKQLVLRMRGLSLQNNESWLEVWGEHENLISNLEKGDKAQAGQLIRKHVDKALDLATRGFAEAEEAGSGI